MTQVIYPNGGKHYICRWYTQHDGHHIILTTKLNSLYKTILSIVKKEGIDSVEIKELFTCELVSLSAGLERKVNQRSYENKVNNFHFNFLNDCFYSEQLQSLSDLFEECKEYKSRFTGDNPSNEELNEHNFCDNCYKKLSSKIDKYELYYRYHKKYQLYKESINPYSVTKSKLLASKAEKANPKYPIYLVSGDFGHHCKGLEIVNLKTKNHGRNNANLIPLDKVLFYFQYPQPIDRSVINTLLKNFKNKQETFKAERKLEALKRQEQRNKFRKEKFLEIFK